MSIWKCTRLLFCFVFLRYYNTERLTSVSIINLNNRMYLSCYVQNAWFVKCSVFEGKVPMFVGIYYNIIWTTEKEWTIFFSSKNQPRRGYFRTTRIVFKKFLQDLTDYTRKLTALYMPVGCVTVMSNIK